MSEIMLSIILPVYNAQETLHSCLHSMEEDLENGQIELIAIDDGSTDGSYHHLELFRSRYPERVILVQQSNGGQGKSRNRAIRRARGVYLGFIDADDSMVPGMFTAMLDAAIRKNADMVICDFVKVYGSDRSETVRFDAVSEEDQSPHESKELLFSCGNSAWNKVVKKEVMLRNNLWFAEGMIYEDLAMIPILISKCENVLRLPMPLYYYTISSASTTHRFDEKVKDHLQALHMLQVELVDDFSDEVLFLTLKELMFYALPRYSLAAGNRVFQNFYTDSIHFFLSTYPQWKKNVYVRRLPLAQRIYLQAALGGASWFVYWISKFRNISGRLKR
jgi:glycosyltransferase involved in cell wall biosynthesis